MFLSLLVSWPDQTTIPPLESEDEAAALPGDCCKTPTGDDGTEDLWTSPAGDCWGDNRWWLLDDALAGEAWLDNTLGCCCWSRVGDGEDTGACIIGDINLGGSPKGLIAGDVGSLTCWLPDQDPDRGKLCTCFIPGDDRERCKWPAPPRCGICMFAGD